ncbi:phage integrase SAM-like domain-containing protein [Pedobacter sp. N36a]|uniref:site-specific integrase n=1 Tax=Pedobacter sp. N36a TaxID=2767996 RepID=UPI001656AE14|nr:site-specific integrase [Pedobacter sp. N36a]MBC8984782.1 phage integrase SAM-like domain-containing protein [Pedobacter sp. N36a]
MGTIRFDLRKDMVSKKTLKSPLRIIYQIQGERFTIQTKIKLHELNWDLSTRLPVFVKKKDALKLNPNIDFELTLLDSVQIGNVLQEMNTLTSQIRNIEKRFEYNKQSYSGSDIIKEIKQQNGGKTHKDEAKELLFNFIDQYISDHLALREPGSLNIYKSVKTHLMAFEQHSKIKVKFDQIDYSFFAKFQTFLINHRNLGNSTIAKLLSTLKTLLSYARRNNIKISDSYKDFTIKKETLEVIALEQDEFNALYNLDLSSNKRLDQTKDVFLFACVTGFRYSDVAQLKREHIHNDVITITVKKTKTELSVPLNAVSASILSKYKENRRPLPVVSNQKLNDYVKELCQLAGIDKPQEIVRFRGNVREINLYPKWALISFHNARKTFASLSLEKGMSTEEVMKIGGWEDYKSFKRYVKVTEQRKKLVMVKAWGEVSNLKVV